jgi:hypothetical protein
MDAPLAGSTEVLTGPTPQKDSTADLSALTLLIVLLLGVPSILIFTPLGSAGTPADVLGLLLLILWIFRRISRGKRTNSVNPIVVAMLVFLTSIVAAYLAAATRPITPIEISAADRGLLSVIAWLGMLLGAMDGPLDRRQLDTLMRRVAMGGGALATVGLLQFVTKMPLVNYIVIPGLRENNDLTGLLSDRNNLTRPPGTAIHPIEFGAVLTMILPFALHYAMHDTNRSAFRRWYPVAAIGAAVPISISRSAILSATLVLIFLLPTWAPAIRRRAGVAIVALFAALYLVVPGLLGTLTGLFTGISNDSSASSRTDSYSLAFSFIARHPIFGRGFRTFLPQYRILDNQLLGAAIEMGLFGLAALLGLMLTGIISSIRLRKMTADPATRQLAQAMAASIAAGGASFALYDALSFPMAACMFFFLTGCAACLYRLISGERQASATGVDSP